MEATAFALTLAGIGLVIAGFGVRARRPATDVVSYLQDLDAESAADHDEYAQALRQPFVLRAVRPFVGIVASTFSRLTPRSHAERMNHQLMLAGLHGSIRAEELLVIQAVSTVFGLVTALFTLALANPAPGKALLVLVMLPAVGALLPMAWLRRRADSRQESIFRDMPDALDLLAISVEAGVGFEAAMAVVCDHFVSPLAEEFSRTLKEMELGLSRREALHNLKRRTEVPELSNFVLALTQADALGMPIGRVLHTQAHELRNKRRQWAREKAAKLPVKILFPLVLFIFPAVLVVILGPALGSIVTGLR